MILVLCALLLLSFDCFGHQTPFCFVSKPPITMNIMFIIGMLMIHRCPSSMHRYEEPVSMPYTVYPKNVMLQNCHNACRSSSDDQPETIDPWPAATVNACYIVTSRRDESVPTLALDFRSCAQCTRYDLPRAASGITKDLAPTPRTRQYLHRIDPNSCPHVKSQYRLRHVLF